MLFEFCIFFIAFSMLSIFFIIISSDTRGMHTEHAERLEYLNHMLVSYVAPCIAFTAFWLVPIVIHFGT